MRPPLLPEETLARVYRLARLDGTGVLLLSGAFALAAAAVGDHTGMTIGLLVSAAGAMELHGTHQIRDGNPGAMRWLIASQIYLMITMLGYCALRLTSFDPAFIDQALTPEMRASFLELGYTVDKLDGLVSQIYYVTYGLVAFVTIFYQGAMTLYYFRRRDPIRQAIEAAPLEE